MTKKNIKRSVNWDQEEKDVLIRWVLDKLDIVENPKIDTNTNKKKRKAWSTIHELFKEEAKTERTLDQIQQQWRKIKKALTTKLAIHARWTDDCPMPDVLTVLEEEIKLRLPKLLEIESNDANDTNENIDNNVTITDSQQSQQAEDTNIDDHIMEIKVEEEFDEFITEETAKKATACDNKSNKSAAETASRKELKSLKRKRQSTAEGALHLKVLEASLLQKKTELELMKKRFEVEQKVVKEKNKLIRGKHKQMKLQNLLLETQIQNAKEEHILKVAKLKMELEAIARSKT